MKNIEIRHATSRDCLAILLLRKEGLLASYPNSALGITKEAVLKKDFDGPEEVAKWTARLDDLERYRTWVAELNGQIVGCCSAKRLPDSCEIYGLFVTKSAAGLLLSRRLAKAALTWLGRERDILLKVVRHNPVVAIYKRCGFVEFGQKDSTTVPGIKIPLLILKRPAAR
jgi:GNAT superfamily N-acetyltransferase